jgi:hypothetical protein
MRACFLRANVILLVIVLPLTSQTQDWSVVNIVKTTSEAVVLITIFDSFGKESALGSGFLVSSDGKVVTNYHVVRGAHAATVKLTNGAFFKVDGIIAESEENDIAVLKVSGRNLPFLKLADSDKARIGERVVAIGSPLGLESTVSDGIVSGIRAAGSAKSWIQTTAPVSHGNSGGPLINENGEVIGIITMGVNPGEAQNLNFAVPINLVRPLIELTREPRPLGGANYENTPSRADSMTESLWTSMTSGRDFKLRREGEFLYTEWVNLPEHLKNSGVFIRSELKKEGDVWRGTSHSRFSCQYSWRGQLTTNWCSDEVKFEINKISATRIEGWSETPKIWDCRKCQGKQKESKPFVWIPK